MRRGVGLSPADLSMHFEIEVNGRVHAVTIERTGTRYRIEADGRTDHVDVARVRSWQGV